MTLTNQEAQEIKTDIALLKKSTADTLEAIHEQSTSGANLLNSINELTSEIREDRIRRESHDEKQELQNEYTKIQIDTNSEMLNLYKPVIERLIISQGRWDRFINAIFSRAGTVTLIIIVVAILYLLGFDPKSVKL